MARHEVTRSGNVRVGGRFNALIEGENIPFGFLQRADVQSGNSGRFLQDSCTGANGTNLTAHVGEIGASWSIHPITPGGSELLDGLGFAFGSSAGLDYYFASGIPASADYTLSGDLKRLDAAVSYASIRGRFNTLLDTCYSWGYNPAAAQWELYRAVAGVNTLLGAFIQAFTVGTTVTLKLKMTGAHIQAFLAGVVQVDVVDATPIVASGRAGISFFSGAGMTNLTGIHVGNLVGEDT